MERRPTATGVAGTTTPEGASAMGKVSAMGRASAGEPPARARHAASERPPADAEPAAERVAAGRVAAAHGIRGELAVETFSDVPGRFAAGASLLLTLPGAPPTPVSVAGVRPHKGRLLLRLVGVEDRDARSEEHTSELQSPCNLVCR